MVTLDRLVLLSTALFATAALLVLISISRPQWILSVNKGETSMGLIEMCILSSLTAHEQKCFIPNKVRLVWIIAFGLSIVAIGLLIVTIILFVISQYGQTSTIVYGRLAGFIAMIFLCLSAVLFPMGFDSEIIGGSPFQLPTDYRIGSSYIAFICGAWLTVISVIVAGKMCLPRVIEEMTVNLETTRRTLPAPMLDRSSYSIFSVIKQAIGKDLTRFSIPVIWNEPLSFLQRVAECLEYSMLLDQAVVADTIVERFHLITAFVISTLSAHLERMSKPFNPLLGETYELNMKGNAQFHYVAEQVCHHPPVTAVHVNGQNWTLSANIEPKIKFHGTNVVAVSEGRWVFRIKKNSSLSRSSSQESFQSCNDEEEQSDNEIKDEYTWKTPTVIVHNVLFGRLWCEFQGQVDIKHLQSKQRSLVTIKPHSWFASQSTKTAELFKYTGFIYDGKEKLGAYHGNYGHCYYAIDNIDEFQLKPSISCSANGHNCVHLNSTALVSTPCDHLILPSSRLIWNRSLSLMTDNELVSMYQYYFFTPFATSLNEQTDSLKLPPTDSRFRKDIYYLEKGDIDAASQEKHRLEEQQRADAKKSEREFEPLWFKKDDNDEYIYTGKYEQRKFDHCPKLFSQSPDR
ncbi:unnamed protein product [Rotaria socialis]|uniref:Oxysterol-binding protein n=1 Tax=Rotaria socialis TaxID=392032 RepID=A0A817T345_9BILA|nr:unnamed protein product [Rotaria socialis]CAF3402870.1 unnamed protein product [Rotaria socialis]